tara:strand:+ start:2710 stop:3375 length:666 start_codon:yes stop_codon:yes gene_type:complete
MKRLFLLLILISFTNTFGQCSWKDVFPFEMGSSKFDVMRIVTTNSMIEQPPDKFGVDRINNGLQYYDYLQDSVYINVINLKFKGNKCIVVGNDNHIQLRLSDDILHRAEIEIEFSKDEYNVMLANYKKVLELVPEDYKYEVPHDKFHIETREKIGEAIFFSTDGKGVKEKLNDIDIGYIIKYKRVYDKVSKKWYRSNEIQNYSLIISITDLRKSRLTTNGY